jgi:hypothetical protein
VSDGDHAADIEGVFTMPAIQSFSRVAVSLTAALFVSAIAVFAATPIIPIA